MTEAQTGDATPPEPETADEWGAGLTPGARHNLAEFADWFARTQAPDLADFVEEALVQALAEAELTYSIDSGGLMLDLPGTGEYETAFIELPDKVTEKLADVNGDEMWAPSATEREGLVRTRAMLARWLELVDARLALPTSEGETC